MNHIISEKIKLKAQKIKLLVLDVDGVLTDGVLVYGPDGEQIKHFNVKDGVGIKLLQAFDVPVAIISAKDSLALAKRIEHLSIKHAYTGCKDKLVALTELIDKLSIKLDEVAYCGDDVIDLKVMQKVGLSLAPADAYTMVQEYADVVTKANGGKGVAREVADLILASRMDLKQAYIKAMLPEFEERKILSDKS
jgi:3-deoxy-D-manno-octulosonate 8-phosphate phosphatase (KDO 8-P phosphatase)